MRNRFTYKNLQFAIVLLGFSMIPNLLCAATGNSSQSNVFDQFHLLIAQQSADTATQNSKATDTPGDTMQTPSQDSSNQDSGNKDSENQDQQNQLDQTDSHQKESDQGLSDDDLLDDEFQDDDASAQIVQIPDPLAPVNKVMYHFNDKLYFWFLKPIAKGYNFIVPTFVRTSVKNFFFNIEAPVRVVNCLLQGKTSPAGAETARFIFNTTCGLFGLADPAKDYPQLNPPKEDLGQTLAVWGVGDGFYLVLPFLGPSSLRDAVGTSADEFLTPQAYVQPYLLSIGISSYEKLNNISFHIGDYETLKKAALDPYTAMRDAYFQYRSKEIKR